MIHIKKAAKFTMICVNQGRQRYKHLLLMKTCSVIIGQHLQAHPDSNIPKYFSYTHNRLTAVGPGLPG